MNRFIVPVASALIAGGAVMSVTSGSGNTTVSGEIDTTGSGNTVVTGSGNTTVSGEIDTTGSGNTVVTGSGNTIIVTVGGSEVSVAMDKLTEFLQEVLEGSHRPPDTEPHEVPSTAATTTTAAPTSSAATTTTAAPTSSAATTTTDLLPRREDYEAALKYDRCLGAPGSDQWCFFRGQATSFVAWRLNSINFGGEYVFHNNYRTDELAAEPKYWGHARDWDDAARRLRIAVDDKPAKGAIAQWERQGGSTYGFVAYVENVEYDDDGKATTIYISDMNSDGRSDADNPMSWMLRSRQECSMGGPADCPPLGWPDNFIHIADT